MIISLSKFTLDIDVDRTKKYYSTAKFISEDCSCSGCRIMKKQLILYQVK